LSHGPHPPIEETGLDSECLRCADLARKPWLLDVDNIARLAKGHCYSDLDRSAAQAIREIVLHAERFTEASA
jgi:hypothetical protein